MPEKSRNSIIHDAAADDLDTMDLVITAELIIIFSLLLITPVIW